MKRKLIIVFIVSIFLMGFGNVTAAAKQKDDIPQQWYDEENYSFIEDSFENSVILRVLENGDYYKLTIACLTEKRLYYINISPDIEIIGENGDILTASELTPRQQIDFTGNKSVLCIAPTSVKCKSMNVLGTDPAAYDEAKAIYMKFIELPLKCGANVFIPE